MCDMCLMEEEVIGTVCGDWRLVRARKSATFIGVKVGDYVLTQGQDATFVLTTKPVVDPHWRFTDAEYDALTEEEFNTDAPFMSSMLALRKILTCSPLDGYELYGAALAAGYIPVEDGDLANWLAHTMGVVLAGYRKSSDAPQINSK